MGRVICISITEEQKKIIKENNISPSKLFKEALHRRMMIDRLAEIFENKGYIIDALVSMLENADDITITTKMQKPPRRKGA